jgi:type I restriction enzyme S subunit
LSVRFEDWARAPFDRILANERESHTLASLRDALLPKLLSGEVRLNRAEQITEVVS